MLTFNSEKYEINSKKNVINASTFVCRKRFDWWFPAIGTGTK
jgi:hypothetical protein